MVAIMGACGTDVPRCGNGHAMTCVRRGSGVRSVCPDCLGAAMTGAERRAGRKSVNDFLAAYDAGELPRLAPDDAAAAETLIQYAQELHGDPDAAGCRRVVRDVAKAAGVPVREVMGWELRQVREPLRRMAMQAA